MKPSLEETVPAPATTLRERTRLAMQGEVRATALRLFDERGFDKTTMDEIASEAGLSRTSLFRYFGTKEDIVLGQLEVIGSRLAEALVERPEGESAWTALRRTFDVVADIYAAMPEQSLVFARMLEGTPSLRARRWEKQQAWQQLLAPEAARRSGASSEHPKELEVGSVVAAALACLDVATAAWTTSDGKSPFPGLLDQAMGAVGNL